MKTTGILGGMSWQSTAHYYRLINEETARLRGGLHSAPLLISSVDFHEIEALQRRGDWQAAGAILAGEARKLEAAGAELLVLATNTMHKVAQAIIDSVSVPLLHIAEATRDAAVHAGYRRLGLLGTRFTMEESFYTDRLIAGTDLSILTPDATAREQIDRIIFSELCLGTIRAKSRAVYLSAVRDLVDRGAEAVILGCTEIGMLIGSADTDTPLLDTTEIHARSAVRHALELN
ncbi:MAG: aspartate/glutamate racemase family protein [Spirochaetaceae bacterium]|nr:MAG: aspartate/glutamate racemase family protein [Spirochaetaceae bacterium]